MSIQKSQLYKIKKLNMEVIIPQIILGESLSIIARESSDDDLKGKLYDFMSIIKSLVSEIGSCFPSIRVDTVKMAGDIMECDSLIGWTDAVFISYALIDSEARFVFTTDTKI